MAVHSYRCATAAVVVAAVMTAQALLSGGENSSMLPHLLLWERRSRHPRDRSASLQTGTTCRDQQGMTQHRAYLQGIESRPQLNTVRAHIPGSIRRSAGCWAHRSGPPSWSESDEELVA